MVFHQRRIDCTANCPVSASVPTLTQPVFAAMSYTPYGATFPSCLSAKSWTLRLPWVHPTGSHSRPLAVKFPTSSFFLVSTLITGSPVALNAVACALRYPNCASRSGCWLPSIVLAFACRLYPVGFQQLRHRRRRHPMARGGQFRRPVSSSTSSSTATPTPDPRGSPDPPTRPARRHKPGSVTAAGGRPAPGRRTRPGSGSG